MLPRQRLTRSSSRESFDAYRAEMSGAPRRRSTERSRSVAVVVATCTGCERLGRRFGVDMKLVTAAAEPDRAIAACAARRHGGFVAVDLPRAPFLLEEGWDDWRMTPVTHAMTGGRELPSGLSIRADCLRVELPSASSVGDLRRGLRLSMAHMSIDASLNAASAVLRRHESDLPITLRPRYSAAAGSPPAPWERVEDIFVFDPWRDLGRLAVHAFNASRQASGDTLC